MYHSRVFSSIGAAFLGLSILAGEPALSQANPFDPSAYLKEKKETKPVEPAKPVKQVLKERAVYRIAGRRFQRYEFTSGAVYIESPADVPDFITAIVICPQQIKVIPEVIEIRTGLPVDDPSKKAEEEIREKLWTCYPKLKM